jgi:hypothetical protein
MNPLPQSPLGPRSQERRGYDVDPLLRAYFRAEMPAPWPELVVPAKGETANAPAPRRPQTSYRSRFALAASLLLLLSGMFSSYTPAPADQAAPMIGTNPRTPKLRKTAPAVRPVKESRRMMSGAMLL